MAEHDKTPSDEPLDRLTDAISQYNSALEAHEQELDAVWSQTTSEGRDEPMGRVTKAKYLVLPFLAILVGANSLRWDADHSACRNRRM